MFNVFALDGSDVTRGTDDWTMKTAKKLMTMKTTNAMDDDEGIGTFSNIHCTNDDGELNVVVWR